MKSLTGLSIGDAFGQQFFSPAAEMIIERRGWPAPPWEWTDDTAMACCIVRVLADHGVINQDELAKRFAEEYEREPGRGYGPLAHGVLRRMIDGDDWCDAARDVHYGEGSLGNGGAMRAGVVGAFFAEDIDEVVRQAQLSAAVTHAHPDGQAGAIAVATAAATAFIHREATLIEQQGLIFDACLSHTPGGATREGIKKAVELDLDFDVATAVAALGNGSMVRADDTVPFAIWCAARHLDSFENAMWTTVSGLGDRDTTCAMVGSIVVLSDTSFDDSDWLAFREPLPSSVEAVSGS